MKVFFLLSALLLWSACCEAGMEFAGGMLLGAGANCDNRKDATRLFTSVDVIQSEHPEDSAPVREYRSTNENCKITCFRMTAVGESYNSALMKVSGGVGFNFVKVRVSFREPVVTFRVEMDGICPPPASPSTSMPSVPVTDAEPEKAFSNFVSEKSSP